MKFQKYIIAGLFALMILLAGYFLGGEKSLTVEAQSTPVYSYAAYVTDYQNIYKWQESDADATKKIQDFLDSIGHPVVYDLLTKAGAEGWDLKGIEHENGVSFYIFEKAAN